uniref:Uncharacterized protein n=1 Tax=Pediastrum duplex TaxID=3105 RepID=A0A2U8GIS4_PEDDU|nr:hypothetical protein [Pediastrum duplex]
MNSCTFGIFFVGQSKIIGSFHCTQHANKLVLKFVKRNNIYFCIALIHSFVPALRCLFGFFTLAQLISSASFACFFGFAEVAEAEALRSRVFARFACASARCACATEAEEAKEAEAPNRSERKKKRRSEVKEEEPKRKQK